MQSDKISIHSLDLKSRKKLFKNKCPGEYKKVFDFLRLSSLGEINKNNKIGEVRQRKYLDMLSIALNNLKSLDQVTKRDMQDFVESLQKNKIRKQNKENYSDVTKQDILIILRTYIKWRLPERAAELTGWFDTKVKDKTPEILTEREIEALYNSCKNNSERFLISVLFDGGFRIEEFLNIRFEDIQEPTQSFPYYKITIKEEYSKTEGRTIGLYWKHSTEAIKVYLSECDSSDIKKQVFPKEYDSVRMFITRLGKKILKRRVNCHMFRKSSATYYANQGIEREKLCIRYGWKFSSPMVDIYIKRSGIHEEEIKEKIVNTDLDKLQRENNEIKTKMAILQDSNLEMQNTIKELVKKIQNIPNLLPEMLR